MTEYIQVITTTNAEEEARKIQRALVEERAAACVQVLGPITSVYWWEGKIEEAGEWICLIKTSAEAYPKVETLIKENHLYEVPEIIATPIVVGSAEYLAWVGRETSTSYSF